MGGGVFGGVGGGVGGGGVVWLCALCKDWATV